VGNPGDPEPTRPAPTGTFIGPAALFLRLLGIVYAIAFASFAVQARGLVGSHGILPAAEFLERLAQLGPHAWMQAPGVFWWSASDSSIVQVSWIGAVVGLAVTAGIAQAPLLAVSWILYISVCSIGQDFLGFQWDSLLAEAGFLAIWLAPWRVFTSWRGSPRSPLAPLWLLRILLFRLMVASAAVKLFRNDQTWLQLKALDYHYWTQPIPTWTAFFAHQMPAWTHALSTFIMFVIEGVMPFGIFLPRPFRLAAFASLAGLQIIIGMTGNYGYFNLLTVALCVLLLDDACLPQRWRPARALEPAVPTAWRTPRALAGWTLAGLWLVPSAFVFARSLGYREAPPELIASFEQVVGPFRLINGYGLFAHMTTERLEITIEGSRDGVDWRPYTFKWKPGDPQRRPAFVEPHMPRLDWQMWFAALGSWKRSPWFKQFLDRLLEGSPDVLALLESNPFPDAPPEQIRARFDQYRFSSLEDWEKTGDWWEVGPFEGYSTVLTRRPEAQAR
jgi:hypothetical protein